MPRFRKDLPGLRDCGRAAGTTLPLPAQLPRNGRERGTGGHCRQDG
ncbi:MAG: hypothetical protein MJE68_21020 [Proteobacteria bacterium]|nr:hypothetical protein [Pseudomonadota bacterium]